MCSTSSLLAGEGGGGFDWLAFVGFYSVFAGQRVSVSIPVTQRVFEKLGARCFRLVIMEVVQSRDNLR